MFQCRAPVDPDCLWLLPPYCEPSIDTLQLRRIVYGTDGTFQRLQLLFCAPSLMPGESVAVHQALQMGWLGSCLH